MLVLADHFHVCPETVLPLALSLLSLSLLADLAAVI